MVHPSQAGASIAGIFNWISSSRYVTDNGVPRYDLDIQPAFPQAFRQLRTGPMPHLATPGWWAHVKENQARAWASSPIVGVNLSHPSASGFTAPLLLIQGDADEEVDFEETIATVRALRMLGITPQVLTVPDEGHGLDLYAHQRDGFEIMLDFFLKHL